MIKAENEDAIIQRKYDPLNRLLEETTKINNGPTHTINYLYQADHLSQINYADQLIHYSYGPDEWVKT